MLKIIRKLKSLIRHLLKENLPKYYIAGENTIASNAAVSIRNGERSPHRCTFGSESVISGQFVLETSEAKIQIGDRTFIGGGQFISTTKISIGSDVLISWGCTFIDTNAHSLKWNERADDVKDWKKGLSEGKIGAYKDWSKVHSKEIKIGDKCWIGFNSIILKGVEIGEGAVIGAGSVVTSNVPPYTVYAGNPAKFVKKIGEKEAALEY